MSNVTALADHPRTQALAALSASLTALATARRALCAAAKSAEFAHLDGSLLSVVNTEVTARLQVRNAFRAVQKATPRNTHAYWHLLAEERYFWALDSDSLRNLAGAYEELACERIDNIEAADEYATDTHGKLDESGLREDGTIPGPVFVDEPEDNDRPDMFTASPKVDPPNPDNR